MKSNNILRTVVGASFLLTPFAALAGIDGTHHDMKHLGVAEEKCSYCHSVTLATSSDPGLKKVGNFCVLVCHSSGSGLGGRPGAVPTSAGTWGAYTPAGTPIAPGVAGYGKDGTLPMSNAVTPDNTETVFTGGHGMNKTLAPATETTFVTNSAWPHTQGNELQCTSCHAIHDGDNPPFLNAQLDGFCQKCHGDTALRNAALGDDSGNHPIGFKWDPTAATGRKRDLGPFNGVTNLLITATGVTNAAAKTQMNDPNSHWNMGGHVLSPTTGLPVSFNATDDNIFTCVSCHTVHETTGGATGAAGDTLTVGNDMQTVCYGCHSIEPGISDMGHPIGSETPVTNGHANWATDLTTNALSAGYAAIASPYNAAATGSPKCVTCHDVHGGASGRKAIRVIGALNTYPATTSVCDACHTKSFSAPTNRSDWHHPGAASTTNYTQPANGGFPAALAWATQDGNGDLSDGLACQDCHVGDGNSGARSTAHNW